MMMSVTFKPLAAVAQLETAGFNRSQAVAIATVLDDGIAERVTKHDLELALSQSENRLTARFGIMLAAGLSLAVAILGAIITLSH
jgi:hypothetical protein